MDPGPAVAFAVVLLATVLALLKLLLSDSLLPWIAAVFVFTNILERASVVPRAVLALVLWRQAVRHELSEMESAVAALNAYAARSKDTNRRRRTLFRRMLALQQKRCADAGYLRKLDAIDDAIGHNQRVLSAVAQRRSGAKPHPNYRVIEALGHFVRDWALETENAVELEYILRQLDRVVPAHERSNTCVVVPGSGLGRVAHEIAQTPFYSVHAVEFSGIMHLCHAYVYRLLFAVYPYIHTTSNFVETALQFRKVEVAARQQPANLHLLLEDFLQFQPPEGKKVVVVLSFFVDTAENPMAYLDKIKSLGGHWINVGPLKYGTAAQVELLAEEFAKVRRSMGFRDLHSGTTLHKQLVGYSTDLDSLWQGYYGLAMWTCRC